MWKSTSGVHPRFFTKSFLGDDAAVVLRRAARNRHRHAIEQARVDGVEDAMQLRTRRKILTTQAQTILDAMDASDRLDTARLGAYTADMAYDLWSLGVVLFHLATGTPMFKTDKNDDVSPKGLRKLVKRCFDLDRKLAVAAPRPTDDLSGDLQMLAFDLIRKLLTPEPVERNNHFPGGMRAVLRHGFFSNDRGAVGRRDSGRDDEMDKLLEEMRASQARSCGASMPSATWAKNIETSSGRRGSRCGKLSLKPVR